MSNEPGKRIIILLAFCISVLSFFINLMLGGDFLYAAYTSICVMLISSLILLQVARAIVMIMANYLSKENELAKQTEIQEYESDANKK